MPIRLDLPVDSVAAMEGSDIEGGAFDADQVQFQFICQTGPGEEHDPDKPPDNRVRPEHAALHVRIAQPGGEESLNVASAAAICLHASATCHLL
jgi:hypothetical protein